MVKFSSRWLFLLVLSAAASFDVSGQGAFADEIAQFKKQDSLNFPPKGATVFVGSSSIRLWKNLPSYFPRLTVINRGFGGSRVDEVIYYFDDVIAPYDPKQVVIYCGENDVAAGVKASEVALRTETLVKMIRKKFPTTGIIYVSIKPSPSRKQFLSEVRTANELIKAMLSKYERTHYVDVYAPMVDAKGEPIASLFADDNLHMNEKGYRIWQQALAPVLK